MNKRDGTFKALLPKLRRGGGRRLRRRKNCGMLIMENKAHKRRK